MPQDGSLIIRAFLTQAQLPIEGAAAIVTRAGPEGEQTLEAMRFTDRSGVTAPVLLPAPPVADSEAPDPPEQPFSSYTVLVEHPDYSLALFEQVQIFPGVTTVQDVPMRPLRQGECLQRSESGTVSVTPQPL